jgi:hypothetical protein
LRLRPLLLRRRLALHRLRPRLFDGALLVWHGSGLWLFWPDLRLLWSDLLRVGSGLRLLRSRLGWGWPGLRLDLWLLGADLWLLGPRLRWGWSGLWLLGSGLWLLGS